MPDNCERLAAFWELNAQLLRHWHLNICENPQIHFPKPNASTRDYNALRYWIQEYREVIGVEQAMALLMMLNTLTRESNWVMAVTRGEI